MIWTNNMGKKKFSSELIISISAIIIAVVSVVVTVWQGIETRRHNRLSVQPRLELTFALSYKEDKADFTLKNKGLGPAILGNATAVINGTTYNLNDTDRFFEFLDKMGIGSVSISFDNLEYESTVIPNETLTIFSVKISDLKNLGIKPPSIMTNVKVSIKYKSLYEEDFVVTQE